MKDRIHLFLIDSAGLVGTFQNTVGQTIDFLSTVAEKNEKVTPYVEMAFGNQRRSPRKETLKNMTQVLSKSNAGNEAEEELRGLEELQERLGTTLEDYVRRSDAAIFNWMLHAFSLGLSKWNTEIMCEGRIQTFNALITHLAKQSGTQGAGFEGTRQALIRLAGPNILIEGDDRYCSEETLDQQPLPFHPAQEGDYAVRAVTSPDLDHLINSVRTIPNVTQQDFPNPEKPGDLSHTPKVRLLVQKLQSITAMTGHEPILVAFLH